MREGRPAPEERLHHSTVFPLEEDENSQVQLFVTQCG